MLGQGYNWNLASIFQRSVGLSENSLQQAGPDALQLISWGWVKTAQKRSGLTCNRRPAIFGQDSTVLCLKLPAARPAHSWSWHYWSRPSLMDLNTKRWILSALVVGCVEKESIYFTAKIRSTFEYAISSWLHPLPPSQTWSKLMRVGAKRRSLLKRQMPALPLSP